MMHTSSVGWHPSRSRFMISDLRRLLSLISSSMLWRCLEKKSSSERRSWMMNRQTQTSIGSLVPLNLDVWSLHAEWNNSLHLPSDLGIFGHSFAISVVTGESQHRFFPVS